MSSEPLCELYGSLFSPWNKHIKLNATFYLSVLTFCSQIWEKKDANLQLWDIKSELWDKMSQLPRNSDICKIKIARQNRNCQIKLDLQNCKLEFRNINSELRNMNLELKSELRDKKIGSAI